ncbi:MAG: hypothetical protein AAGF54_18685, partial [Pseudomonadota bacterium]
EGITGALADEINAYTSVDIAAGVYTDRWSIEGFFDNVFDETFWLSNSTGGSLQGTFVTFVPRTFGVRLSVKFGSLR